MNAPPASPPPRGLARAPLTVLCGLVLLSAAGHLGALRIAAGLDRRERAVPPQRLRVVVVDKPPPVAAGVPSPLEPPVRPTVKKPAPRPIERAPRPEPPAAPASLPPEDAPSTQPPLLVPGMALSSTSQAGSFAVPVGNTLAGRPGASAPAARADAQGDGPVAPGYALTEQPVFLDNVSAQEVRRHYPEAARRAKLESVVLTRLTVGADGRVVNVEVTGDPGQGFGQAAAKLARLFRFKPARIDGRPVATEIPFTIRFELD